MKEKLKSFFDNRLYRVVAGVLAGIIAGVLYYKFVGCNSGTCAITSNPYRAAGFFGIMGGLLTWDKKKKKIEENEAINK